MERHVHTHTRTYTTHVQMNTWRLPIIWRLTRGNQRNETDFHEDFVCCRPMRLLEAAPVHRVADDGSFLVAVGQSEVTDIRMPTSTCGTIRLKRLRRSGENAWAVRMPDWPEGYTRSVVFFFFFCILQHRITRVLYLVGYLISSAWCKDAICNVCATKLSFG